MTYDERREIGAYIDIVKKNCNRVLHSVEMLEVALEDMHCKIENENEKSENVKQDFLKHY